MLFQIVGFALLVPFFGWAIYLLRRRFVYHEENSLLLEAGTAAGVLLFFWVETTVLKYALGQHQMLLFLFAVLGLVVAGFALYAHVIISLASRILVDMVVPGDSVAVNTPRFGPVESLERMEDFEGALQEYLVLARIFPRNFEVLKRTGRVNEILDRNEDAITWYMRARTRATGDQEALAAVNRICAIYDGVLEQPDEADAQLAWFIETYPDSPDRDIVRDRLERRAIRIDRTVSGQLEALEETPFAPEQDDETQQTKAMPAIGPALRHAEAPEDASRTELVTLASAGVSEKPDTSEPTPGPTGSPKKRASLQLESMELAGEGKGSGKKKPPKAAGNGDGKGGAAPKSEDRKSAIKKPKPALQPLDDVAPAPQDPEPPVSRPKSGLSLEAMDDEQPEP